MKRSLLSASLGVLALVGGCSNAQAGSYTVKPVRIELSARKVRTTVQIINLADKPTTIQAHIVTWTANGTEEVLSDSDDVLLNPPIFTLAPGQQQMMRLGLRHSLPPTTESTFRLILEEVPPPPEPGFNGVATVLKISVPIFVNPAVPAPHLRWAAQRISDQRIRVSVQNDGNAHIQIKQLALTKEGRGEPDFVTNEAAYVLRNGRKEWVIRQDRPLSEGRLSLDVRTDGKDIREDLALQDR